MGSSQPSEEVTASADGITVIKRFEEDEFPVPAIAFEFRSAREEPVTVRLRDAVPDGVAVEDLGFHPEYGSEYWTVDEGAISFEREIAADAEYATVYGIRATGAGDIEQFLVEPMTEAVDSLLPESPADPDAQGADSPEVDVVPGDREAVKEAIAGEGTVPGLEDEGETVDADEDTETVADVGDLDLDESEPDEGEGQRRRAGTSNGLGDTVHHALLATPAVAEGTLDRAFVREDEGDLCISPRYERLVEAVLGADAPAGVEFTHPDTGQEEEAAVAETGLGVYLTVTGSTAREHGLVVGEHLFPSETVLLENSAEMEPTDKAVAGLFERRATAAAND